MERTNGSLELWQCFLACSFGLVSIFFQSFRHADLTVCDRQRGMRGMNDISAGVKGLFTII